MIRRALRTVLRAIGWAFIVGGQLCSEVYYALGDPDEPAEPTDRASWE